MREVIDYRSGVPADARQQLRTVDAARPDEVLSTVRDILAAVKAEGDAALARFTATFDGARLTPGRFRVTSAEIEDAVATCSPELMAALGTAAARIDAYHRHHAGPPEEDVDDGEVRVVELRRPVDRAGLYAPGGLHAYPSSVLMLGIPARVAGVPEVALAMPPRPDGTVDPASLAAAHLAGITEIWRIGGAQAIAALAYGTETVPAVDLIVGPGNAYVALAKQEVAGLVGIESLAGPSELAVVADAGAPPDWIALDLRAQAEHGPLGSCLLITWEPAVVEAVADRLAGVAEADSVRAVLVDGPTDAVEVCNAYAPEHLQLMMAEPEPLLKAVRHAGAVFCGYDTPTALGDYVAGPNHVLPTAGTARFAQSLRVGAFQKVIHAVFVHPAGYAPLAEAAATIADAEGLTAHARSLRERLAP